MTLKIRKASIEDTEDCVKLIYISGPHLFSYLFLKKEPEIIIKEQMNMVEVFITELVFL